MTLRANFLIRTYSYMGGEPSHYRHTQPKFRTGSHAQATFKLRPPQCLRPRPEECTRAPAEAGDWLSSPFPHSSTPPPEALAPSQSTWPCSPPLPERLRAQSACDKKERGGRVGMSGGSGRQGQCEWDVSGQGCVFRKDRRTLALGRTASSCPSVTQRCFQPSAHGRKHWRWGIRSGWVKKKSRRERGRRSQRQSPS